MFQLRKCFKSWFVQTQSLPARTEAHECHRIQDDKSVDLMQSWATRTKVWTKPLCLPMRQTICASNLAASDVISTGDKGAKENRHSDLLPHADPRLHLFEPGDNIEFQKERIERLKQEVVSCHTTSSLLCQRNLGFVTSSHTFTLFSSVLSKTILQAAAEEQRVQEMQAHSSARL